MDPQIVHQNLSRDSFDRRVDNWLQTGKQFVDGVSGRRPGQRFSSPRFDRRYSLNLGKMGRWVGEKIDWLMEDDDRQEPWQEKRESQKRVRESLTKESKFLGNRPQEISRESYEPSFEKHVSGKKAKPLLSAKSLRLSSNAELSSSNYSINDDWPEDENFTISRWQRKRLAFSSKHSAVDTKESTTEKNKRILPRSNRRRN